MPENTSETAPPAMRESGRQLKPERIMYYNNKVMRRLQKLLVDYPNAREVLNTREEISFSESIPTFDETPNGGLDMTREWGNSVSSQGGEKTLKVQPPVQLGILEESINMIVQGNMPSLEVRIVPLDIDGRTILRNSMAAFREAMRIVNRLGEQLALKKKVLDELPRS